MPGRGGGNPFGERSAGEGKGQAKLLWNKFAQKDNKQKFPSPNHFPDGHLGQREGGGLVVGKQG